MTSYTRIGIQIFPRDVTDLPTATLTLEYESRTPKTQAPETTEIPVDTVRITAPIVKTHATSSATSTATQTTVATVPASSGGSKPISSRTSAIIGSVGVVLAVAISILLFMYIRNRRRKIKNAQGLPQLPLPSFDMSRHGSAVSMTTSDATEKKATSLTYSKSVLSTRASIYEKDGRSIYELDGNSLRTRIGRMLSRRGRSISRAKSTASRKSRLARQIPTVPVAKNQRPRLRIHITPDVVMVPFSQVVPQMNAHSSPERIRRRDTWRNNRLRSLKMESARESRNM